MSDPFTRAELEDLSAEIDRQLVALGTPGTAIAKDDAASEALCKPQREAIEKATGEDAASFLARFRAAAHDDLCKPGGILNAQWTKWKDLANKDLLKTFGGILVGMGLSGGPLQLVAVAVSVYVLYLGVQAFCKES